MSGQAQRLTPSHSNNSSITASPFNANILQALGQQQVTTPTNKSMDVLDDSLGMLSTVALLDSEISHVNTTAGTSVQEKLAGMRIHSRHGEQRLLYVIIIIEVTMVDLECMTLHFLRILYCVFWFGLVCTGFAQLKWM